MRLISSFSAAVAFAFAVNAHAGVVFFTDQATWSGAAGTPSFSENFSGFATDASFRTAPVALNGMTISQQGVNLDFRNFVDVPPLANADNNATANASTFTEGDNGTQVRITFNALNGAFGFQTWGATSLEGATLDVFSGASLLGSQALTGGLGDFLGYLLTSGDTATSVLFRSTTSNGDPSGGEGFGLDNLVGVNASPSVSVPEPGSLALLGIALGAFGLSRRRKKA